MPQTSTMSEKRHQSEGDQPVFLGEGVHGSGRTTLAGSEELGLPSLSSDRYDRIPVRRRFSLGRFVFQIVGFLVGLGLFGWCLHLALSAEETREGLARLFQEAGIQSLGVLVLLSTLSLTINGLAFWITLSPIRRLRILDVIAVNTLATIAANLPFKLSAVLRVLIHNRHDGLAIKTIIAWFAAMAL